MPSLLLSFKVPPSAIEIAEEESSLILIVGKVLVAEFNFLFVKVTVSANVAK
jgi:hypothetical protein